MAFIDYFPIVRDRVRRREFNSLFLFVTSRCNSLCRTCFYFDKLNSRDDLTFAQIERISETAGPFRKLWISGGEPFLRDELGEIIGMFARRNGVRNVNLPSNGLLPDRMWPAIERMTELCPETSIDLNFSIDGLQATHDAIRGVPGGFTKTLGVMAEAARRYRGLKRLRRNVLTVITRENYDDITPLAEFLRDHADIDGQYFQVVRGGAPDPTLADLTREAVAALHTRLMPFHEHYADRLFAGLAPGVRDAARLYYLGNLRFHFDLHESCLEGPEPWPMACTAGETTIVIDHNGRFRACEMRGIVGDLHEYDFDIHRALDSEAMRAEVTAIPGANCWCTHSCFIQESAAFSPKAQLVKIPLAAGRRRDRVGALPYGRA